MSADNSLNSSGRALPKYKCHKEVWALKIASVEEKGGGYEIGFVEPGYGPVRMPQAWVETHLVSVGGYFVVYADGYQSFSPAKAFEEGYGKMEDGK